MIQGGALGSAQKVHERLTKHSKTDRSESGRKTSPPLFAVRGRLTRRSELARAMRAAGQYPPQDGAPTWQLWESLVRQKNTTLHN